jgi:stage V sporulation protein B
MIAHMTSHIFEQIIRLIITIILLPLLLQRGITVAVSGIVLFNIISEFTSILILFFFLPHKVKITKEDIKPDKEVIKDVLNIGIPTTGSRLIGSLGYFFEPIILTFILLKVGYSSQYIINEYGILNGYVLPLLMIPSFFTQAIASSLIPVISKGYVNNHIQYVKDKVKQALLFSIGIGIIVSIIILIKPAYILKLIYNTTEGVEYLKLMTPFFLIYYIQVPYTATLQAINKAKEAMMSTIWGTIIKTILIFILALFKIGLYSLIIASIVNILIVTIYNERKIKKALG